MLVLLSRGRKSPIKRSLSGGAAQRRLTRRSIAPAPRVGDQGRERRHCNFSRVRFNVTKAGRQSKGGADSGRGGKRGFFHLVGGCEGGLPFNKVKDLSPPPLSP